MSIINQLSSANTFSDWLGATQALIEHSNYFSSNVALVLTTNTNVQIANTNAQTANTNANLARDSAVIANTNSWAASVISQTASNSANNASVNAQVANTNSWLARIGAETANTNAQSASLSAQTANTNAQVAATSAQTANTNAWIAVSVAASANIANTNAQTAANNANTANFNAQTANTNAQTANTNAWLAFSNTIVTIDVRNYGANGNGIFDNTTAFTNAKTAANVQNKNIFVSSGNFLNGKPSSISGKNVLWNYYDGGDADNVLTSNGDRGGFFADYDCKATEVKIAQINENQSSVSGGGFRDVTFFNAVDTDTTNYTAIGQKVTHGIRSFVQGSYSGGAYNAQYKDLVGGFFAALGNIAWDARGVSAILADAVQLGSGIASNEFAVNNPSSADGSAAQSKSMAAIQAIVRSRYANEDATHVSRCVYVENNGERITAGIQFISNTSEGFNSHFKHGILLSSANVTNSAIVMPQSATGNTGTIIEYDTNDYTFYDRTNNSYGWAINAIVPFVVKQTAVGVGTTDPQRTLHVNDVLRLEPRSGPPSSPSAGDIYYDSGDNKLKCYNGTGWQNLF